MGLGGCGAGNGVMQGSLPSSSICVGHSAVRSRQVQPHLPLCDLILLCIPPAVPACRQWIAEENRHGDVLGRYLYLSGRVDMKQGTKQRGRAWLLAAAEAKS